MLAFVRFASASYYFLLFPFPLSKWCVYPFSYTFLYIFFISFFLFQTWLYKFNFTILIFIYRKFIGRGLHGFSTFANNWTFPPSTTSNFNISSSILIINEISWCSTVTLVYYFIWTFTRARCSSHLSFHVILLHISWGKKLLTLILNQHFFGFEPRRP